MTLTPEEFQTFNKSFKTSLTYGFGAGLYYYTEQITEATSWWPKFDGGGPRSWSVRISVWVK